MPKRPPVRIGAARQILLLALFGVALGISNRFFVFIDDETSIIAAAADPVRKTLGLFWSGVGQHEHPPLYDLLLHFWLWLTGGAMDWLRAPSICFYILGLWLLSRAALRLAGETAATVVIWMGVLWPFGFHYARLTTWYSFSFFLVSALTLAYFRLIEKQDPVRWTALLLASAALLWTNYLGWALIVCLLFIEQWLRRRNAEPALSAGPLFRVSAILIVIFIPLFAAFRHELAAGIHLPRHALTLAATAAFNAYSLFVSEAVAPWFWRPALLAGAAILASLVFSYRCAPRNARRFFLYLAILFLGMALTGILQTKRLLLISPWLLLPLSAALAGTADQTKWMRRALGVSMLLIAAIGWFGIVAAIGSSGVTSRDYYAAPRFIEPWPQAVEIAAQDVRSGAIVIGNNPSFFFYLTYALQLPRTSGPWRFAGTLPVDVRDPQVMLPEDWLAAGHPIAQKMVWVRGMAWGQPEAPMHDAASLLDKSCGARVTHRWLRDSGFEWKQRFFPQLHELLWRVEIREYDCGAAGSKEILHFPMR